MKKTNELCHSCQTRLEKNALRVFDCKNPECQKLLDENAPLIFDSISEDDRKHFDTACLMLDNMGIPYFHDKKLVRGLDYYSHTTFEITSSSLGAQDALCGGGRYNGLIEQLGGKPTPAVGFAAGVERLILAINRKEDPIVAPDIYMISLGEKAIVKAFKLTNDLRKICMKKVVMETLRRSMKAQMREAGRCAAAVTIILGDEELTNNIVIIKDMVTSIQQKIPISDVINYFKNIS